MGKGSYGQVYKVKDLRDGREYVLKKIAAFPDSPTENEAAMREARLLAQLRHPHVVRSKSANEGNGLHVLRPPPRAAASAGLLFTPSPHCPLHQVPYKECFFADDGDLCLVRQCALAGFGSSMHSWQGCMRCQGAQTGQPLHSTTRAAQAHFDLTPPF